MRALVVGLAVAAVGCVTAAPARGTRAAATADSLQWMALTSEEYELRKASGELPQPPTGPLLEPVPPGNTITPEALERCRSFLVPLDESFRVLGAKGAGEQDFGIQMTPAQRSSSPNTVKCGTLDALRAHRAGERRVRPTLSGPEVTIDSAHFRIHYTTGGADATTASYASNVSSYAENCWVTEVTSFGWDAPPSDGTAGGGNGLYDIYLVATGYAGWAEWESAGPDPLQDDYTSFIAVGIGMDTGLVQVTVAHEFNHACQFSYSVSEADWWYENTATWMEDEVYDSVNDYLNYLASGVNPLSSPELAITAVNGWYEYGGALWCALLDEVYGRDLPRLAWQRMAGTSGDRTLEDLNTTLVNGYSSSLAAALETYAVWRYFTGSRADAHHFSEGATFPASPILRSHSSYPATGDQGARPVSAPGGVSYVELTGGSEYLRVLLDGQDGSAWAGDLVGFRAPTQSTAERMLMTARGRGSAVVGWSGLIRAVLVTVVTEWQNPSASRGYTYSAASPLAVAPFAGGVPPLYRNDDSSTGSIPLSFDFCFYGTNHDHVYINNNGNLSFQGPYSTYTPTGFPVTGYAMTASFWADIDTRNSGSGVVYYKSEPHRLIVIWDRVGYYSSQVDKRNTFELVITDGTDPAVGVGKNVGFSYGDMQWTTGSASGGVGGFGGSPATVGVNMGDGTNYALVGRFDHDGVDYDGPGGHADGISYLDDRTYTFGVCSGVGTIRGVVFLDADQDGVHDSGEAGLPSWTVTLSPGGRATTSGDDGAYMFSFLEPGTYVVAEVPRANWFQTCPPVPGTYTVDLTEGQTVTGRDFGNAPNASVHDLAVSVAAGRARPGFQKFYSVNYQNKGTLTTDATVELELPSQVQHLDSSPGGTYSGAWHSVTWELDDLWPGESGGLWTRVQIPASAPLGTVLTASARIEPAAGDAFWQDNEDEESQVVVGSYDPNDKAVAQAYDILSTDLLDYQVNFQNVGTDTAFTVIVRDTLDPSLDIATLRTGPTSHTAQFQIVDRELSWAFQDIDLPCSSEDEAGSQGFVTFAIQPEAGVQPGTEISNRASVYFDFNAPVITNTVANRVRELSSGALVAPNPFRPSEGHTRIAFVGDGVAGSTLSVFTKPGQRVAHISIPADQSAFYWVPANDDGEALASGIYVWVLTRGGERTGSGKLGIIR